MIRRTVPRVIPFSRPLSSHTPGPGRPRAATGARRLLAAAAILLVLAGGCTSPLAKPAPGDRAREAVTALADDSRVQQELARGRGEVIAKDPAARRVILGETLREQRRMLDDPALRGDYLELNARLTRAVSAAAETRPRMLENTVDLLEGVPDDPELRRRLVNVMRELLQDPALKADLMALVQVALAAERRGPAPRPPQENGGEETPPAGEPRSGVGTAGESGKSSQDRPSSPPAP